MTDHADTIRRAIIGHAVQACYDNGESWNLVCDCQWECWEQPDERTAKALHARHRADEEREAEAALDALLAERQQLLDDLARAIETFDAGVQEAQQDAAHFKRAHEIACDEYRQVFAQRQQAIDALRELRYLLKPPHKSYAEAKALEIVNAVLVKIEEKP